MKKLILILSLSALLASCSNTGHVYSPDYKGERSVAVGYKGKSDNSDMKISPVKVKSTVGPSMAIPNATAFRMSGDFAGNVAITLSPEGEVIYFPAPSDITADSEPIDLGNGWWLNRQGIGQNSVFTKYTFAEYAALPEAPSIEQLKFAIIPGAKVTQFVELPMNINQAPLQLDEVKEYVKNL